MTQLQKDLSILIPEINKTISKIPFDVVGGWRYLKVVTIIEEAMYEVQIRTYEELEDALITYLSMKYNRNNILFGYIK